MSVAIAVITKEGIAAAADSLAGWFEEEDCDVKAGEKVRSKPFLLLGGHHKMWAGERCAVAFTTFGTSRVDYASKFFQHLARICADKVEPRHAIETLRPLLASVDDKHITCLVIGYDTTEAGPAPRAHLFTKAIGYSLREGAPQPMYGDLESGAVTAIGNCQFLMRLCTPIKWGELELDIIDPAKLSLQQAVDFCAMYIDHSAKMQRFSNGHTYIGGPYDLVVMRPGEDASFSAFGALSDPAGRLRMLNV